MIDNRIFTFLELCTVMNYHKTAENLNMTQPAVTQHIKYLENMYGCKLFVYENKKLSITKKGLELERYARTIIAINQAASQELIKSEKIQIKIGATKTIGDYMLDEAVINLIRDERYEVSIIIDNTAKLLERLNHFELDLVILEGYVDKEKYNHIKIKTAEIVGICAKSHPFVGKEISLEDIFREGVALREKGSGTRNVFEHYLYQQGYTIESFVQRAVISSNRLIERVVENQAAISFVYDSIPKQNGNLETFRIKGERIQHEFNYVFLNEEVAKKSISLMDFESTLKRSKLK